MALIEVNDVSFGYTRDLILENVNMAVDEGEYVGIIGANGAGKTTLMKLILGELTPVSGQILIDGRPIGRQSSGQQARFNEYTMLGYVPQVGFSQIAGFPVNVEEVVLANLYSQIGMFHLPGKEHLKQVESALSMVGMSDFRRRLLSQLSGGQQQRVMIARALVNHPKLLLLDEPFTGIDEKAEAILYDLLYKLHQEEKLAILMISHDTEQIARYTNRFYHIKHRSVHEDHSSIYCDDEWRERKRIQTKSHYYAKMRERENRGKE